MSGAAGLDGYDHDIPGKPISEATRADFQGPEHWVKTRGAHEADVCGRCGEIWPCFVTELREEYAKLQKKVLSKETLALIICATYYCDFGDGDNGVTWEGCVESWEKAYKTQTEDDHFGDCTGQPTSCMRCQYEEIMTLAGKVVEALGV